MTTQKTSGQHRMFCVTGDTILLGDNKPISDVEIGNDVIGQSGSLAKVTNVFNRTYDGEILTIRGAGLLPFSVTPEHPILVCDGKFSWKDRKYLFSNLHWIEARKLIAKNKDTAKLGHFLIIPVIKPMGSSSNINLRPYGVSDESLKRSVLEYFPINKETSYIIGLYVAEGHSTKTEIVFSFNKNEIGLQNSVIDTYSKLGYNPHLYEMSTTKIVRVASRILARMMPDLCGRGAHNKKIPDPILFHEDTSICEEFIRGYLDGDGYQEKTKRGHMTASTVSKTLALQLQLLSLRLGRVTFIHKYKNEDTVYLGRTIKGGDYYHIAFRNPDTVVRTSIKYNKGNYISPIREIRSSKYTGEVYNIESSDDTFLASNVVTHNCSNYDCGFVTDSESESIAHQTSHAAADYQIYCYHEPTCATLYDHKVKNGDPEPWQKSF